MVVNIYFLFMYVEKVCVNVRTNIQITKSETAKDTNDGDRMPPIDIHNICNVIRIFLRFEKIRTTFQYLNQGYSAKEGWIDESHKQEFFYGRIKKAENCRTSTIRYVCG